MNYDTLVISGGSVKGIFLLGAIQSLIDLKLGESITTYVGTSAGAIISYLLCIGYTPIEIIVYLCTNHLIEKLQSFNLTAVMHNDGGAISYHHINETLETLTIEKIGRLITLNELKNRYNKKLYCATYNITLNKTEYLSWESYPDMPCLVAVRLSANIPFLFDRYKYMGNHYIDGGISDNFPIKFGEEIGGKVIGLYLEPASEKQDCSSIGIIEYIYKILQVPMNQSVEYRCSLIDKNRSHVYRIKGDGRKIFDFNIKRDDKIQMFSSGYQDFKDQYRTREKSSELLYNIEPDNYSVYL
jgi:predicted acylesterase/phospholipase RssA